jgi:signal transduction histidine kinase
MAIVLDDINRLNRLISDISDASRLDAELMRGEVRPVDLQTSSADMVRHYVATARQKSGVEVDLRSRPIRPSWRTATTAATARCSATSSTTRCRSARPTRASSSS